MTGLIVLCAAGLFGVGTWLLLQRKLSRIIIGVGLLGHGANLLLLSAGRRGDPPFGSDPEVAAVADPLPHAMALTAIVITFGITTFLLALAHRSWKLTHDDVVEDDIEDRYVARRTAADDAEIRDQEIADATPFDEVDGR